MSFRGEYQHNVDDKGRLSLPAKFRKALPEDVTIVPGFQNALYVFSDEAYERWVASFFPEEQGGYSPLNKDQVKLRKLLNAKAESVSVDAAGRVMLSQKLRSRAGIEKNVAIIGDEDHIEIWDAAKWEDYTEASTLLDDLLEG